jgi:hypothetical protein
VYIVTPVPLHFATDIFHEQFCQRAVLRGIADYETRPSRAAEDARNQIMREVLKRGGYSHFFFLDADSFPYDEFAIEKLMMHNKPVIAGPTPTQRQPVDVAKMDLFSGSYQTERSRIRRLWNVVVEKDGKLKSLHRNEFKPELDELPKNLFKCVHVGCTGLLVSVDVIAKLKEPFQKTERDNLGNVVLSEDYYFCQNIRNAGYDIWIDPAIKSGHRQTIDIGAY